MGGRAIHWEEALDHLRKVDILVACTGASRAVLTKKDVAKALRGRRLGPLFLIDIAVPRDIDPRVNQLNNVYLYDIDALQGVIESNLEERRLAAEHAKRMIGDEVISFDRWVQSQEVTPLIVSLRASLLGVGEHELERHRAKLGQLDDKQQRAVEELTRAIIQKILHRPIRRLRASVDRGDTLECMSLYREIFGMEEADDGSSTAPSPGGPRRLIDGGKKGS
jgi:glutamyl-tRNA reductase